MNMPNSSRCRPSSDFRNRSRVSGCPQASLVDAFAFAGCSEDDTTDGCWLGTGAVVALPTGTPVAGRPEVAAADGCPVAVFGSFPSRSRLLLPDPSPEVATESLTTIRRASLLFCRTMNVHCVYRPACQMKAFVDPEEVNALSRTSGPLTVTLTMAGSPTATMVTSPVSKWISVSCLVEIATSTGLAASSASPTTRDGAVAYAG